MQMGSFSHQASSSAPQQENNGGSKKHVRWTPADNRTFIDACKTTIAKSHHCEKCFHETRLGARGRTIKLCVQLQLEQTTTFQPLGLDASRVQTPSKLINCTGV